ERPRAGSGPRVDHAHLQEVETAIASGACEPAARFVDFERYPGQVCKMIEVAKPAREQTHKDRIELDAGHVAKTEHIGRQQVPSAANTDHCRASTVADVISEIGNVVF